MVRTVVVIGLAVAVVYILVPRPTHVSQPAPDVRATVAAAAEDLGRPGHPARVADPAVPQDWHSNAASWDRQGPDNTPTLHVGYVTGDKQYAAMEVTPSVTKGWLDDITHDATRQGVRQIAGRRWQSYVAADGRRSLVLARPAAQVGLNRQLGNELTTVVTGTVGEQRLADFAAAVAGKAAS